MVTTKKSTCKLLDLLKSVIINQFKEITNEGPIRILDLFSGYGTITFHLSSFINTSYIALIDSNKKCTNYINKKIKEKELNGKGISADVSRLSIKMKFDLIIIDPPYKKPHLVDNAIKKIRTLMNEKCLIIIKMHKNENIYIYKQLSIYRNYYTGITNTIFMINYNKATN